MDKLVPTLAQPSLDQNQSPMIAGFDVNTLPYPNAKALLDDVLVYMPDADTALIAKAYDFILKAHEGVMRDSGDPYVSHPLSVTQILVEEMVDTPTLIAGLLHDVVEDTDITRDDIAREFSEEIAGLVDGVTKLTHLEIENSPHSKEMGNLLKFTSFIARDLRVLIIKIADRIHNMRTLHHKKKLESRRRSADETVKIFVPFANYAGLTKWKEELQDLAFKALEPNVYETIISQHQKLKPVADEVIDLVAKHLSEEMTSYGLQAAVSGRLKTPYSTWNKIRNKDISLEDVSDILGFRILVDDEDECYRALGVLHRGHRVVGDQHFDDYISNPKPNGYKSLHTVIYFKPDLDWADYKMLDNILSKRADGSPIKNEKSLGIRIEVQIRSHDMDAQAELGDAAHWFYKTNHIPHMGSKEGKNMREKRGKLTYLQGILNDFVLYGNDPQNLTHHMINELGKQIIVFTPGGKPLRVPRGSTLLDFAFFVHTDIGLCATGAKLDGRYTPLKTPIMQSGHVVEILNAKKQQVSNLWKSWVKTPRASSLVNQALEAIWRKEMVDKGMLSLERVFQEEGYLFNHKALQEAKVKLGIDGHEAEIVAEKVGRWLNEIEAGKHPKQLPRDQGWISPKDVLYSIYPVLKTNPTHLSHDGTVKTSKQIKRRLRLEVNHPKIGKNASVFHFANCCCPLPGERIIGFMATDTQVSIHRVDCYAMHNLEGLLERWVDVEWEEDAKQASYLVRMRMTLLNRFGVLNRLTTAVAKEGSNISNLKFRERNKDVFIMDLELEVSDVQHYHRINTAIRLMDDVSQVKRY